MSFTPIAAVGLANKSENAPHIIIRPHPSDAPR